MTVSSTEGIISAATTTSAPAFVADVPGGILVGADGPTLSNNSATNGGATSTTTNTTQITKFYTDEDLARARAQEKEKLYPEIDRMKEELSALRKEREEREAEEARLRAEAEEAERRKAEEEMDVRTLLEQKQAEYEAMLEAERMEREKAFALLEQERQFQELQAYRQQRVAQESENIIPELLDLVDGSTPDEIEMSIAGLRERSSRILESAQSALQAARRDMVGARVTAPAAGPLDTNSDNQSFTADQISNMSFNDYVKNRSKLLGQAAASRNSGLFG